MIGMIILACLGMGTWLAGIILLLSVLFDYSNNKMGQIFVVLVMFGLTGMVLNCNTFFDPSTDVKILYIEPTSIIKTNNVTVVNHIVNGEVYTKISRETDYWNSTNIMVQITSGNNLYGCKVKDEYEIVIK
jgi:hypothetical protein